MTKKLKQHWIKPGILKFVELRKIIFSQYVCYSAWKTHMSFADHAANLIKVGLQYIPIFRISDGERLHPWQWVQCHPLVV